MIADLEESRGGSRMPAAIDGPSTGPGAPHKPTPAAAPLKAGGAARAVAEAQNRDPVLAATGRWIAFWRLPRYAPRITEIWEVRTADHRTLLGEVRWFAQWRRYSFFPQAGRVFEATCLRDVANFCERETQEHGQRRRERAR